MFVWEILKELWREFFPKKTVWKFTRVEDDYSVSRLTVTCWPTSEMESVETWVNTMMDDGWTLVESPREFTVRRKS